MRLTIISPLFPPDTAPSSVYAKVLLRMLAKTATTVTGIVYGHIPESVPNVSIVSVPKRQNVWWRLVQMLRAIHAQAPTTNVFIICNGPSTEVPFWFFHVVKRGPYIFVINDTKAAVTMSKSWWKRKIHNRLIRNAEGTFIIGSEIETYYPPEIHPLLPQPTQALEKFNNLWQVHTAEILHVAYGKK